ncbi:MAG: TonB-dependent receptor [Bacteroidales bacterium]|nr:TonB-dependent receptor [Bacteroidales bacterium]
MQIGRWAYGALLLLLCQGAAAQEVRDTLKKSQITERLNKPMLENFQGISGVVNTTKIASIPSFLGNADPLRFVRLLPSVQLSTELEGGLYMQGSDHSHTRISQGGVPLYGIQHLLGLFSVFNTPHYKGMQYTTSAGPESRLGGAVDMQLPDTLVRKLTGTVSVGLLSAQGTLRTPVGEKSALTVSLRRSFVNLLYSRWLHYEEFPIRYGFTDGNLTWQWKPSARDHVWVDFFGGSDYGSTRQATVDRGESHWYNAMGAVHWTHYFPSASLKQSVFATTYGLDSNLDAFQVSWSMPSFIREYGYRGTLRRGGWETGARLSYYDVQPQNPSSRGTFTDERMVGTPRQKALEGILYAQYDCILGYWLQLKASLGVNLYHAPDGAFFWMPLPEVDLKADLQEKGTFHLCYGLKRQNLFQLGITNIGLPIEFWMAADSQRLPQQAHNFSLSYNLGLKDWKFSAEAYYKILENQLEYTGSIMDIYYGDFSLESSVTAGRGRAWGVNLMVQRTEGPVTGWISYSYGRSLRTFYGLQDGAEYPSAHERLHEVDAVASWHINDRWDFGATFVLASGLPYTAPESLYVLGNRLICEYGPYNGARFPTYSRLDLSATWHIRQNSGLTFSLYNALGRKNAVALGIRFNEKKEAYSFQPLAIYLRWLPSVSYYYNF